MSPREELNEALMRLICDYYAKTGDFITKISINYGEARTVFGAFPRYIINYIETELK